MTNLSRSAAERLTFRDACTADIPALQKLYRQLIPDESPSTADMEETLAQMLAEPHNGGVIVAELDGEVVATCQLVVYRNLIRTPHTKAMIDSVIVSDDHRQSGIGTRMMHWAVEHLRDMGCSKVIIATSYKRKIAHQFYEVIGFEPFGVSFIWSLHK